MNVVETRSDSNVKPLSMEYDALASYLNRRRVLLALSSCGGNIARRRLLDMNRGSLDVLWRRLLTARAKKTRCLRTSKPQRHLILLQVFPIRAVCFRGMWALLRDEGKDEDREGKTVGWMEKRREAKEVEGRDGGRERGGEEESVLLRGGRNRY